MMEKRRFFFFPSSCRVSCSSSPDRASWAVVGRPPQGKIFSRVRITVLSSLLFYPSSLLSNPSSLLFYPSSFSPRSLFVLPQQPFVLPQQPSWQFSINIFTDAPTKISTKIPTHDA